MLRTPFYKFHEDHDARFVDFAGWQMPIRYQSILAEHRLVRNGAGMFDVSHMGRLKISGVYARCLLERVLTRRVSDMAPNCCRYSLICNEQGGTIDDVIVYRFEEHWLVVCNAANRGKVLDHLRAEAGDRAVRIDDQTESTAMVALQGPGVMPMMSRFSSEVPALKRYAFCVKNLMILKLTISRTGYTGEDGIEVIMSASMASMAIKLLYQQHAGETDIALAGLGARDTLRTEAGMPLYGHELDESTDPLSAGLDFAVSLDKDAVDGGEPFIGQEALKRIQAQGPKRQLTGLRLEGRRTARAAMPVRCGDRPVGQVTSGCLSPTLGYPIAMAYVDREAAANGSELNVDLGRTAVAAEVVPMPFYKRKT